MRLTFVMLLLMPVAASAPAFAQQPRARTPAAQAPAGTMGTLRGVVYDSLARMPLAGARVLVQGTALGATTDDGGRFRIDSVPAGQRTLFVEHAALDTVGLSNLTRTVTVLAGRPTVVELALPSLWTMRRAACAGRAIPMVRDSGLVYGVVRDAESGVRLAGARVLVSWISARRGQTGVEVERPGVETRTDSLGNYYACDIPTDIVFTVQAAAGALVTGQTERLLGARGVARHDLALSRSRTSYVDSVSGARRGRAVLAGVVRTEDGNPRPGARVSVDDAAGEAFTDADGRFVLAGLPSGSQMVMARVIGFTAARAQVDLRDGDTVRTELAMRAVNVLDTIRVTASARTSAELDEIQERARMGVGYRLSEEELRTKSTMRTVFTGMPSLNIEGPSAFNFRLLGRVPSGYCNVNLYIDGRAASTDELQSYRPDLLIAVEYFPRAAEAPLRYQSASSCSVMLVWTRFIR